MKLVRSLFEDVEKFKQEEREDPELQNVLVVGTYDQWEETQRACRRERKVIALEITNPFSEGCARVRPMFDRLAAEFKDMCIRVVTGPFPIFLSIDKVSCDAVFFCSARKHYYCTP